jgi:nicotinate-nucleotide adenylyltransferase
MRIGMLGGTFDPVHLGHIALAEAAAAELSLDTVLVVPNASPPHKPDREITPYEHRVKMLEIAFGDCDIAELCEMETGTDAPHYTIDTVRALKSARGEDTDLFLLLGSDEAADFPGWRDPEKILEEVTVAVVPRAGCDASAVENQDRFRILSVEIPGISSTEIRERAASGDRLEGLVDPGVADYIAKHALYV